MNRGTNLFSIALLSLLTATPSVAQVNFCDELRGRYVDIDEVIGASQETRQLSRAIVQQNLLIRRTMSDLRRQGCVEDENMPFGGEDNQGTCDDKRMSLDQMRDDLATLMDQREESVGRVDAVTMQRRQLLDAMQRNGCSLPASATPDIVIDTHTKLDAYAPQEQSLAKPESSVTVIETPRLQKNSSLEQKQAPAAKAPVVTQAAPQQFPPDRPYDPSAKKVRQVGPQFLATDQGSIDLKHPKAAGPQPAQ
ncbi:hypothetical protein HGP16_04155 [Rhizobium sp. P40RR-XXII]|uniref:hypothetical protein n=1 Tax=unclassified Rhizobium TaxID=2613769 RepID=UPI001456BD99|nr:MULTISPECIES: hypothetical protein [unclassified Rhizobium]NLR83332.1 hypothetical protein [Rhizobium sp. P28RR-XV]NLS15752.1 hypothetical protein [Rhizobium sp. P40RR-XXII]